MRNRKWLPCALASLARRTYDFYASNRALIALTVVTRLLLHARTRAVVARGRFSRNTPTPAFSARVLARTVARVSQKREKIMQRFFIAFLPILP